MHFTYETPDKAKLYQGDLLKRSPEIEKILKDTHPTYCEKEDYKFFIVLTQSCDLALRNGSCNTKYINIAPARPLNVVIKDIILKYQYDDTERKLGFINEKRKEKIYDFMERLFNNNEHDYFFLYREENFELDDEHCAFLRLSIAIKSESYATLLQSKFLQIKEPYRSKLGFLVGKLYSRVATEDWLPNWCTKKRFQQYTQQPIEDPDLVLWVENDIYQKVLKNIKKYPPEEQTIEKLEEEIRNLKTERSTRIKESIELIISELSKIGIAPDIITKIQKRLENNPAFRGIIK
jgi:hypothetical protein